MIRKLLWFLWCVTNFTLYMVLMAISLALGLVGGAFVSIFLSFKHYFSALHEEIGG